MDGATIIFRFIKPQGPMQSNTPDKMSAFNSGGSLFIGRLAFDCKTRELEELFGKYGRLTRCDVKKGKLL